MSHFEPADRFALGGDAMTGDVYSGNELIASNSTALYETELQFEPNVAFTNPFKDSNERAQQPVASTRANDEMEGASNDQAAIAPPADSSINLPELSEFAYAEEYQSLEDNDGQSLAGTLPTSADFTYSASEPEQTVPKSMAGYAQLVFNDGEYIIDTLSIILGRDSQVQQQYQRECRRLSKQQIIEQERERMAAKALEEYKKEPSHASHPDEEPSSKSDHSLEGRPVPGLPSMCSEQGGIVNLAAEGDDEHEKKRYRRILRQRKLKASAQSSSSASVDPARLHKGFSYNAFNEQAGHDMDGEVVPFVAVHPTDPKDITKISREHARIAYNHKAAEWEMEVLGKHIMVLNEYSWQPPNGLEDWAYGWESAEHITHLRGAVIRLTHHTDIMIASLRFKFRLPVQPDEEESDLNELEPLSEDEDVEIGNSSPARRLSAALDSEGEAEEGEADSEPEVAPADASRKKGKSKKKAKAEKKEKSGLKLKLKTSQTAAKAEARTSSPEVSRKASKKPKKSAPPPDNAAPGESSAAAASAAPTAAPAPSTDAPAVAGNDLAAPTTSEPPAQPTARAADVPLVFEKGTLLGDAAPEELPEKRKGPGRPPKNGLISKRDNAILARRYMDFDKQGIPRPPMKELLEIVRAENKAKEAAAKAAARGENNMIMQSIEGGARPHAASMNGPRGAGNGKVQRSTDDALARASAELADAVAAESKAEAKRTRTWRSPSPVKPEEECTEEELKKPTQTYYITLEAILGNGPPEGLELQQIYDKVMKMYPYFKYKSESTGWQSSVRHNLKQHPRFQQSTKQGKGWMWSINPEVPYNGDVRKKKPSPPRVPQQQQQNGGHAQQAHFQYGNPYAQQYPQQGQQGQQYASPYQRGGQQYGSANQQQRSHPVGHSHFPPTVPYVPYHAVRGYSSLQTDQRAYMPPQPGQHPNNAPAQAPAPPEEPSLVNDMIAWRNKFTKDPQQAPGLSETERAGLFDKIMSWRVDPKQRVAVPSPLEAEMDRQMEALWLKWGVGSDGNKIASVQGEGGAAAGAQSQAAPAGVNVQAPVPIGGTSVQLPASTTAGTALFGVAAPVAARPNSSMPPTNGPALSAFNTAPATGPASNSWQPGAVATNGVYQQPQVPGPRSQAATSGRPTPSPLSSAAVPSRPVSQHGLPVQAAVQAVPMASYGQAGSAYTAPRQGSIPARATISPKTTAVAPIYPQASPQTAAGHGSASGRPANPPHPAAGVPYGAMSQQQTQAHGLPTSAAPSQTTGHFTPPQLSATVNAGALQNGTSTAFTPQTAASTLQQQDAPQAAPTLKRSASDEARNMDESGANDAKRARLG
ncbi:hypothetical protein B0A48_18193 [Cryoendolithus antarcticus]|uniref:Fork-head domain-containing protein n=1 Tax=Cryoendolithus antarcticus TaxID=1507870 RepID=A0A1V8S9F5_9PEZI|nr:hypothetical protein B0A48_18193 [Cryoendolithus antarcticus]